MINTFLTMYNKNVTKHMETKKYKSKIFYHQKINTRKPCLCKIKL